MVRQDLRHAVRSLARTPGFALVVILTLALGIGATTAIFTLAEALLWRPLPVHEPSRLAIVARVDDLQRTLPVPLGLTDRLRNEEVFDGLCSFATPYTTVTLNGRIAPRATHAMSGECFATLGIRPALGRLFTAADEPPGMPNVAVLTHQTWQREYAGSHDVLGMNIDVAGETFTIIGVAERRFTGLLLGFPPQLLFPITQQSRPGGERPPASSYSAHVLARLPQDRTLEQVRAQLQTLWPRLLASSVPANAAAPQRDIYLRSGLFLAPGATGMDWVLRDRFGSPVVALLGLAAIVLLVACVNVASLLLARAAQRRTELCVRLALGATRSRLVQEAAAESALLVIAGTATGMALAYAGDSMLVSMLGLIYDDFALDVAPDGRVLAATSAIAVATVMAFALIPAASARDMDGRALAGASSRLVGERQRAQHAFVVAQVVLTLALIVVGTATSQILVHLRRTPLGFPVEHVLTAQLAALPGAFRPAPSDSAYREALLDRLRALPGVQAAAFSFLAPLFSTPFLQPVSAATAPDQQVHAQQHLVTEDFLAAMQISLVAGRSFNRGDRVLEGPQSVIVSESLARRLFGGRDAIGQRIRFHAGQDLEPLEIVGIAHDAVLLHPQTRNTLAVYRNLWRAPDYFRNAALVLRTRAEPAMLAGAIRQALDEGGRQYPMSVRTLSEQHDAAFAQERLVASLSAAFAGVGLVLAGIGVYGLLNLLVTQRTREIAMRIAVGATPGRVRRLVLRRLVVMMATAMVVGLPLGWATRRVALGLLGSAESQPLSPLGFAIGLLFAVALMASWLPARRASSVDPMVALRGD